MRSKFTSKHFIFLLTGIATITALFLIAQQVQNPAFELYDPGVMGIIDYEQFGTFENVGKANFKYNVFNMEGLKNAVGEGIYPNNAGVTFDPAYQQMLNSGLITGEEVKNNNWWQYLDTGNTQRDFFVWAQAWEDPGVVMFYVGTILEKAGLWRHAIKAYYSVVLHFPLTIAWSEDANWYWFVGPVACEKSKSLALAHPELGMALQDAIVKIELKRGHEYNGKHFYPEDYNIVINPGKWVASSGERAEASLTPDDIVHSYPSATAPIRVVKYSSGDFQLLVSNKPMMVQAVCYGASKIGESYDSPINSFYGDRNNDGLIDGLQQCWVDVNTNNIKDRGDILNTTDGELLKEMGCNAIRLYHMNNTNYRAGCRYLYEHYGIYTMVGNFAGSYAMDANTTYQEGTDYSDPRQCASILASIKRTVEMYKDEDFVLFWILGNENNYSFTGTQVSRNPRPYYRFINKAAKMIHEMDPNHPVAICNGDTGFLDEFTKYCPDVDIFGANSYRGADGFGGLFGDVKDKADRAVFITEYGTDANRRGARMDLAYQRDYHKGNWESMMNNRAGNGAGNALGGALFQWMDEWWKHGDSPTGSPASFAHDFPGGEEWLGIVAQGNGSDSPFLRQLRPAYFYYKQAWAINPWE